MIALDGAALGAVVAAVVCADLRWLRVAQREHYLPGAATRFGWRWWTATPANTCLFLLALGGTAASVAVPAAGFATAVAGVIGPLGLSLRGRTSRLAWTRRMALVASASVALEGAVVAVASSVGGLSAAAAAGAFLSVVAPLLVDLVLVGLQPVEDLIAERYVSRAAAVLARVRPVVVGITGSYGKTTTKGYVAHLVAQERTVVASPRSFNNRAGLRGRSTTTSRRGPKCSSRRWAPTALARSPCSADGSNRRSR